MIPHEIHAEAEGLFRDLLEQPREEWPAILEEVRVDRAEVADAVQSLVEAHDAAGDFMEAPAAADIEDTIQVEETLSVLDQRLPEIPGFKLLELIGAGGMGAVYLAEQLSPHRRVAVKLVRADIVHASALRRFEIEAELLGRLQHPNIARIYATGRAAGPLGEQPYFVMEYIEGKPLREAIEDASTRERVATLAKICEAIHHAHQKGIVHRDLKPGNILIDSAGEPRILDFGIAKLTEDDGYDLTGGTSTGQLLGTLPYMSPEQVSGDPTAVDTRSDIYSLGVVGYELLAGRLPYDLDPRDFFGAAKVIRDDTGTRLGQHSSQYRGDLDIIFGRALEKEPDRRYSSAKSFADDLNRYLNDEPIEARPPSRSYQARKFVRRHRVLVASAATVFVTLVVALGVSVAFLREARDQKQRAEGTVDDLQRATKTMIGPLLVAIESEEKSTAKRRELLTEAIFALEQLTADADATAADRLNYALAYERLSELQGEDDGQVEASRESLLKARAICEELVELENLDPEAYFLLTEVLDEEARYYRSLKQDPKTAEAILEERAKRVDELLGRYPDHPRSRLIQIEGLRETALVQARSGNLPEAIRQLKSLIEEFDSTDLGVHGQRELMIASGILASMLMSAGQPEDGLQYVETSYQIATKLVGIDERQRLGDVMQATKRYVTLRARLGKTDGNDELRAQLIAGANAYFAREPESLRSKEYQSFAVHGAAESLLSETRLDEAQAHTIRYLEISEELIKADPDNANFHRNITVGEALLAQIHKARGDIAEDDGLQRASYREAEVHVDKALQKVRWRQAKGWFPAEEAGAVKALEELKSSLENQ